MAGRKEKLTARFDALQQERERLEEQKQEVLKQVESTRVRIEAKKTQLADIAQITSQIEPFLNEALATLKDLVSEGSPFLMDERKNRIANLEQLMGDPDVSVSERYRKVMEALQVEAEYGFTIETYQETIPIDGNRILADIFRLGRICLFYQSLDRKHCGFYNVATSQWVSLPQNNNPAITSAIDIAAKRRPVEILSLPLGRMVIQ